MWSWKRGTKGSFTWMMFIVVIMMSLLAACASGSNSGNQQSASSSQQGQAASANGGEKGAEQSPNNSEQDKPLVVYLNDFDEFIGPEFEAATGYKIELVSGNGAEIMSRIEAERGNPHWDVVWADMMPSIQKLADEGVLLEGWQPDNAEHLTDFAKSFVADNHAYYPTGAHAAGVIIYNTNEYNADTAPKSWEDFRKPEFKDAIGMADPAIAAPAYPFVSWFFESKGIEEGKAYFDSLFANGLRVYPKNPNVANALLSGEIKAAALQESNAYKLKNQGEPVEIIWPEEGAPASVRVVAIQRDTGNIEAAKAFVEYLLDPKTQQMLIDKGEESYFTPAVHGVEAKSDREADPALHAAEAKWASAHEGELKQWFADKAVQ